MIKKSLFLWLLTLVLLTGCNEWDTGSDWENEPNGTGSSLNTQGTEGTVDAGEEENERQEEADLRGEYNDLKVRRSEVEMDGLNPDTTMTQRLNLLESQIQSEFAALQSSSGDAWDKAKDNLEDTLGEYEDALNDYEDRADKAAPTNATAPSGAGTGA